MRRECYESVGSNSIYFSLGINSGESLRGLIAVCVHDQCELIGLRKASSKVLCARLKKYCSYAVCIFSRFVNVYVDLITLNECI